MWRSSVTCQIEITHASLLYEKKVIILFQNKVHSTSLTKVWNTNHGLQFINFQKHTVSEHMNRTDCSIFHVLYLRSYSCFPLFHSPLFENFRPLKSLSESLRIKWSKHYYAFTGLHIPWLGIMGSYKLMWV